MQFVEVACDECPLSIVPGPMADAVPGVDGRRPGLRAQIGVPGARARSDRGGERLAARVGAREAAQVAAEIEGRFGPLNLELPPIRGWVAAVRHLMA